MTAGGTVANITALWAARECRGVKKVLVSDRAHNSIKKAADLLKLEHIVVKSNPKTHRMEASAFEGIDLKDAIIVLTAGTVQVGAIDDLSIAKKYGSGLAGKVQEKAAWVHVDGKGLPLLSCLYTRMSTHHLIYLVISLTL